jgi:DNA-binding response OmpR family regulator
VARILVIDDDASIRRMLRGVLEMHGYEVVEAENGNEGLQYFWTAFPDVVITDMQMPIMDGLQVIVELRHSCPTAKIIAISGGQRVLNRARPLTQYAFEKPFQLAHLVAAVETLISMVEDPAMPPAMAVAHRV